ncbi:peptidase A22B, signal peptide peptidase [Aureobasidium sp. EXF-10728]|nr:peptidase A22B, signal peptide peptidase [Aureobasidium sp. EXF-10728]
MATNGGDSGPGPISEMLGILAYGFAQAQPLLPLYTHLVLSALFPIITGAYSSLSRPSTAARPIKESKTENEADEQDDQDEDEDSIQKMEGLSPSDAVIFPLLAGCTLGGLYLLIKYMGASLLNKVLRWYFSAMAIFSVAKLINDGLGVAESLCFPHYYTEGGVLWKVSQPERKAIHSAICTRPSPLPGVLGRVILPRRVLEGFWTLRGLLRRKYRLQFHLSSLVKFKVTLTLRTILSTILALATIFYSNFVSDEWWLTNLQGFAFSYSALQLMSPTTFGTGSLILSALFFYDIYFVFYTPLMVTVATKLDVPIKLLFPRPLEDGQVAADRKLAMLGLGDIVIPGMMVGLALRFDLYMYYLKRQTKRVKSAPASSDDKEESASKVGEDVQKENYRPVTGHWGNKFWTTSWIGRSLLPKYDPTKKLTRNPIPTFSKPYFYASIAGYVLGMCVTLGIMQVYRHAQPALLYLVPGVLGSLWLTALVRGEVKQMWDFTEASDEEGEEEQDKKKEKTKKHDVGDKKESTSWWGKSFFSTEKAERNAKRLEKKIAKSVGGDEKSDTEGKSHGKKIHKEKDDNKSFFHFSFTPAVPKTSSLPNDAKKRSSSVDSGGATLIGDSQTTEANGQGPKWRGAGPQETQEERAGKRRRL